MTNDANSNFISLRDYFAASALQAMLSTADQKDASEKVRDAYEIADMMLEARKEKKCSK